MSRLTRFSAVVYPVALALLVVSCSGAGMSGGPSMTYETMNGGGIAVGGVAYPTNFGGIGTTPDMLADMLRDQIQTTRPDIKIGPVSQIRTTMGAGFYRDMMVTWGTGEKMPEAHLIAMQEVLRDQVRYLLFGRIMTNETAETNEIAVEFWVYDVVASDWVWKKGFANPMSQDAVEQLDAMFTLLADELPRPESMPTANN